MERMSTAPEPAPPGADAIDPAPASEYPELLRLVALVDRFRGEGGCAWHEEQTHASLVPYLQEETAELIEAIEAGTADEVRSELGDVLYQVLFHAEHAGATGGHDLEAVARDQAEKLWRRNPHVFGPRATRDIDEIIRLWREAKAVEKASRTSVLDGVAFGMPALALADKVLGKAAQVGLDVAREALAAGVGGEDAEAAFGEALLAAVAAGREAGFGGRAGAARRGAPARRARPDGGGGAGPAAKRRRGRLAAARTRAAARAPTTPRPPTRCR